MNNRILAVVTFAAVSVSSALAAEDTTIADTTTSLTTGFGLIKTLVVSVVVFGLVIGYLKMLKKK